MAISVKDIFSKFNLVLTGQVKWNQEIKLDKCGIYVIALTDKVDEVITLKNPIFSEDAILDWIKLINVYEKTILVDKTIASVQSLKQRLSQYWLPDETIIYIGRVGPTKGRTFKTRMNEFYKTKLGCNKKHAGGHWLNTLANIAELNIFYSVCDPEIEEDMIKYFCEQVSTETKKGMHDKINCFPFANKELNKRSTKKHGISNQTVYCGNGWKK